MSRRNATTRPEEDTRATDAARARAEIERQSEAAGVTPFTSLAEFAASTDLAAGFDPDEFLRAVREDRDRQSGRGDG
jgi:hypothetical protein